MLLPATFIHHAMGFARTALRRGAYPRWAGQWGPLLAGLAVVPLLPVIVDAPTEMIVGAAFDAVWPWPMDRWASTTPPEAVRRRLMSSTTDPADRRASCLVRRSTFKFTSIDYPSEE